jgi:Sulfotransferase family
MRVGAYAELEESSPRLSGEVQELCASAPATLTQHLNARESHRTSRASLLASGEFFDSVREVLVVASCSRSGSSVFAELLSRSSRFLQFPGEINHMLRLAGLAWPISGASDVLGPEHCTEEAVSALQDHFALEVGYAAASLERDEVEEQFDRSLCRRLSLQWPLEEFSLEKVSDVRAAAVADVERRTGRPCDWTTDLQLFHALFLKRIREDKPKVNPYYYDLSRQLLAEVFPNLEPAVGPPSPLVIEEPPFILVRPWVRWQPADFSQRALLIKTPSNAYRVGFLRALFPSARFRLLHLTRNPAASINGMYDGWYHWGFHSHYVGSELEIPGYSHAERPDRGWWKFDLPPGWQEYLRSPLEEICAFQWRAAQDAILEFAHDAGVDYKRIRFEEILNAVDGRQDFLPDLCDWLEIPGDELKAALAKGLSPVMATQAPRKRRWRDRANILMRVLNQPAIRNLSETLGYSDESEWI